MRAAGVRGGIFSVFTPSPGEDGWELVPREDGVLEVAPAAAVDHGAAAADATAAAGRLLALERAGLVRVARVLGDLDRAFHGEGPPVAVLHLEGAEAIDADLEALEFWYGAGLRSLGPVEPGQPVRARRAVRLALVSRHRSGSDRGRPRA